MSYLSSLRVHFAGEFFSDPSTINNDPFHYETNNFDRSKLWLSQSESNEDDNGWWNPSGAHAFKITTAKVKSAFLSNGNAAAAADKVLSLNVESLNRMPAKLVDLDVDQQLVSTIFGLTVKLTDDDGLSLMEGVMDAAPFTEIWSRGTTGGIDERACAAYQSVLVVKRWGDLSASPFLQELKATSPEKLSIKFNVDGYVMSSASPRFATGRIVGTIGPADAQEPKHFVLGRHFDTAAGAGARIGPGFRPVNGINYCTGILDSARGKFRIDVGNSLPVSPSMGPVDTTRTGNLFLNCKLANGTLKEIGQIPISGGNWYENTAGIAEVPAQGSLSSADIDLINSSVLCLTSDRGGTKRVVIEEANGGAYARADMFVARMNPGDEITLNFRVTRFGKPFPNARIDFVIALRQGFTSALNFPNVINTNADGFAEFTMQASDPGNPRFYYSADFPREKIDGQIYNIFYRLNGVAVPNLSDKLSVLVWNNFTPDDPITWHGSMREVMTQYGNLYPIMTKDANIRLDLAEYEQIATQRQRILHVINLSENDPAYMPVSRDMSRAKLAALKKWLDVPAGQKPLLGTAPVADIMEEAEAATSEFILPVTGDKDEGGKSVFANHLALNEQAIKLTQK